MTEIKAVLFDMDGVLIDASDWHYQALNQALAPHGHEIAREEHLQHFDGLSTRRKLSMLTREKGLPEHLHDSIHQQKQDFTMKLIEERCTPTPQHLEALTRLKEGGYELALCSNSIRATVEIIMELAGLRDFFALSLSNQDVKRPKPHPEIYATACARLGLKPGQCLVLEDNIHGIASARACGARIMWIRNVDEVSYQRIALRIASLESSGQSGQTC